MRPRRWMANATNPVTIGRQFLFGSSGLVRAARRSRSDGRTPGGHGHLLRWAGGLASANGLSSRPTPRVARSPSGSRCGEPGAGTEAERMRRPADDLERTLRVTVEPARASSGAPGSARSAYHYLQDVYVRRSRIRRDDPRDRHVGPRRLRDDTRRRKLSFCKSRVSCPCFLYSG